MECTLSGANFSADPVEFFDPALIPADLADDVFAFYLFGSEMPMPEGWDYSGNERHLVRRIGSTPANDFSQPLSQSDYYDTPFTGDGAIADGTPGELTIAAITNAGAGSVIASTQDLVATRHFIGLYTISGGNAATARQNYGGATLTANVATDAHRGTAPEFLAATYSDSLLKAYRRFPGFAIASGAEFTTTDPDTAGLPLRIGAMSGSGSTTATGTGLLSMLVIFNRVLTSAELDAFYAVVHDWIVGKDPTFWDA